MPVGTRARPPPGASTAPSRATQVGAGVAGAGVGRQRAGRGRGARSVRRAPERRYRGTHRPYASPGARLDGPRDDRPRPGPPRDRRDRHARHRRRPRDRGRGPRPRRAPAARGARARWTTSSATCTPARGLLAADRGVDDHPRGGRRRRRSRSSRSTCPRPAPCRCAATRSAPTGGSSPRTCPRSRSTSTTGPSTCPPSRSWPGAGTPARSSAAPRKADRHRALDDIRESIDELRFYRERLFIPTAAEPGPRRRLPRRPPDPPDTSRS